MTKSREIKDANELCKLANERFGLELALKCVLQGKLSLGGGITERLIELAKERNIDDFLYELRRKKTSHGERNPVAEPKPLSNEELAFQRWCD